LSGPEGLRDCVVDGKLRLALEDAIRLTLLNNTDVHLNQLPVEQARFTIQRAYQPFDPTSISNFNATRSTQPTFTQLSGAPTLSFLNQQATVGYAQTLQTGTNYQINFSAAKLSTNSIFDFFNPSIFSTVNFSLTQPLLRNRGLFPNRAPIVIAQRNLEQSRAGFETSVNDSIAQAVVQYWGVVQTRESLEVQRKSLEEAEATYRQNKRALELGALPPLDIYRSESEVATRRVQVIQVEYALKQAEDRLRRTLGADLDPYFRALDLELTEKAEPSGELLTLDAQTALERALAHRPELEALRLGLSNDETGIRVAHNHLLPDVELTALYSSNGLAGNQFNTATSPPALIARRGFGDALSQVFGFGFPTYGFTVQLNLPIRNRGAAADLGNALVGRRRNLYLLRQTRQAITLEVSNAVHDLEQAKLSMAAAKIARDLAQKTLEAEQRKYELGTQPIFFVLQAQTQLAQVELSLLQAEIGYQLAVTALDRATGGLLERHRVQVKNLSSR
jgi:outer membrane protein TolC